jgi:hypothetical protein
MELAPMGAETELKALKAMKEILENKLNNSFSTTLD